MIFEDVYAGEALLIDEFGWSRFGSRTPCKKDARIPRPDIRSFRLD